MPVIRNSHGQPLVTLSNDDGEPHQDIILKVCYRNTPWALTCAHAVGFGIYRRAGLVQFFDDEHLWRDVGYQVVAGQAAPGHHVDMVRDPEATPAFFEQLIQPNDAIASVTFPDVATQAEWVAAQIATNLSTDELEHDDILVIFPDPLRVPQDSLALRRALDAAGINSHISGVTSTREALFLPNSIAVTGIYRAKGNEAAMVYVMNADYGHRGTELIRRRNTIFTAITRSRAWVRVCGVGPSMDALKQEIDSVAGHAFHLSFDVPTTDVLEKVRRIHRDMTESERRRNRAAQASIAQLLHHIEKGDIDVESLDPAVREKLRRLSGGD